MSAPYRAGYVKVYRRLLDHPIWKSKPSRRCVAVGLLLAANHQETRWFDGKKYVTVGRGELIGSRANLAEICGVSIQEFRSTIAFLKNCEFLTSTSTSSYTHIKISNYDIYQSGKRASNQDSDVESTSDQPASAHTPNQPSTSESTTNKKIKNVKEVQEEIPTPPNGGSLFQLAPIEPGLDPPWETELKAVAATIRERHPSARRCAPKVVEEKLEAIVNRIPVPERIGCLRYIDSQHARWCESHDWMKENGQYAKNLDAWLNPSKRLWENEPIQPKGDCPTESPRRPGAGIQTIHDRMEALAQQRAQWGE